MLIRKTGGDKLLSRESKELGILDVNLTAIGWSDNDAQTVEGMVAIFIGEQNWKIFWQEMVFR